MKFKTATYRRVKNLGNYSSEHLEMTIEIDEDDNAEEVTKLLRILVNKLLDEPVNPTTNNNLDDF